MSWLGNLFGRKSSLERDSSLTQGPSSGMGDSALMLGGGGSGVQVARQLIMDSAAFVAQSNGIPRDWLRFEVLTMADESKAYFQLQVTLRQWDAYLHLHSHAFENAVMARLRERNLPVSRAVRAVLWRVAQEAGCPYEVLPASVAWTADATAQRNSNPQLFKANKPMDSAAATNWNPSDNAQTLFQDTHHIAQDEEAAAAELARMQGLKR